MKFLFIFILSFLISYEDNEKFYILQYSVIQFEDGSAPVKFNCHCYQSKIKRIFRKDTFILKTDSVTMTYTIVRQNTYGRGNHTLSKNMIPYVYREINQNGDYYLTIAPMVFNSKYLYGGTMIAISNKKICENR